MRLVALSDTHLHRPQIPDGDVLIHAGDICVKGSEFEWQREMDWLADQPHKKKLYTPGNHDRWIFDHYRDGLGYCSDRKITVLERDGLLYKGVHFQGSPWTPAYGHTRAFMYDRDQAPYYWAFIDHCDVLITHGPPAGILDRCPLPEGCYDLLQAVLRTKPRYHIFGHIHPEGGRRREMDGTVFINAALAKVKSWEGIIPERIAVVDL